MPLDELIGADSVVLEELLAVYREMNNERLEKAREQTVGSQESLLEVGSLTLMPKT